MEYQQAPMQELCRGCIRYCKAFVVPNKLGSPERLVVCSKYISRTEVERIQEEARQYQQSLLKEAEQ